MSSLIDLYNERKPRTIDLNTVGGIIADRPAGLLTGIAELIPMTLKGLATSAGKIAQSISPVQIPYADEIQDTAGGRLEQLLSGATMGIYDQAKGHYQESGSLTSAAGNTIYDLLPIEEARRWTSGRDEQGNLLTSEQLGQDLVQGILEAIPIAKGVGRLRTGLRKGVPQFEVGREGLHTQAELKGFLEKGASGQALAEAQSLIERIRAMDSKAPLIEGSDLGRLTPEGNKAILSEGQMLDRIAKSQGNEALEKAVLKDLSAKLLDTEKPRYFAQTYAETIKEAFDNGDLAPEVMADIAKREGVDVNILAEQLVNQHLQVAETARAGSKMMNIVREWSQAEKQNIRDFIKYTSKFSDDPEVLAKLERLTEKIGPTTVYRNAANAWKGMSDTFRKAAVGQLATTMRNTTVQGIGGVVNLLEHGIADTFDFARDSIKAIKTGDRSIIKRPGDYYADVLGDFIGAWGSTLSAGKSITDLLKIKTNDKSWGKWYNDYTRLMEISENNLPLKELQKLTGNQIVGDIAFSSQLLKNAKQKGIGYRVDKVLDAFLIPSRMAEKHFRTAFYTGKLYGNLKRLGINSLDEFETIMKSGDAVPENVSRAVTDAIDHSMDITFASNPKRDTLGHAVMETYKNVPFLYGLGPMFPRFLVNQYRYLVERDPFQWTNMLSKDFREQWTTSMSKNFKRDIAELDKKFSEGKLSKERYDLDKAELDGLNKLHQHEISNAMARATTGGVLASTAHLIHEWGDREGLKYYQFKTGEKDDKGNDIIADLRPYQPLTSYLFANEILKGAAQGEMGLPRNLTSAEVVDAVVGIRNLSEVPVFAIADIIRTADSSDPMALNERLQRVAGQFASMPFVPLRMLNDMMAAAGDEESGKLKDTRGDMVLGPAVSNTPLRRILPDLPDPLTGLPTETEYPLERQMLGVSLSTLDPLESAMQSIGMRVGDMVGTYKNPEAGRLMRKYIGSILGRNVESGTTMSQLLGKRINDMQIQGQPLPDSVKKMLLQEIFTEVRGLAKQLALTENPRAFLEDDLKSEPEMVRDYVNMSLERAKR
jgi:hypothetical protein